MDTQIRYLAGMDRWGCQQTDLCRISITSYVRQHAIGRGCNRTADTNRRFLPQMTGFMSAFVRKIHQYEWRQFALLQLIVSSYREDSLHLIRVEDIVVRSRAVSSTWKCTHSTHFPSLILETLLLFFFLSKPIGFCLILCSEYASGVLSGIH